MIEIRPLVSIVTPSYNQAQFIEETILSVKRQDYPNLEHIVVDGGSDDGTADILRHYESMYNLHWISEPDEGQSDALNKGFRQAKGDIIGWLNSDDVYMPGAVQSAVDTLLAHPGFGWVYGDAYWTDEDGRILRESKGQFFDLEKFICGKQHPWQPTVFFRREALAAVGYIDTDFHFVLDTELFIRLGLKYPVKYIPQVLATRRLQSQAKTVASRVGFGLERMIMLDKLFARQDLPRDIVHIKNAAYRVAYLFKGTTHFEANQFKEARRTLWRALWMDWRPVKDTILILLLILQSLIRFNGFHPHKFSIHCAQAKFQREQGEVYVVWFH